MKKLFFVLTAASLVLFSCSSDKVQEDADIAEEDGNIQESEVVEMDLDLEFRDFGGEPTVLNIEDYTLQNETFRTAIWTGEFMQLTIMSIPVGGEVGLEVHDDIEQFLRVEAGKGMVFMGDSEDNLDFQVEAEDDDVILVPAGKWHNVKNIGDETLKLYSIYAKPEHAYGTVHQDKAESDADEHHH